MDGPQTFMASSCEECAMSLWRPLVPELLVLLYLVLLGGALLLVYWMTP